MSPSDLQSVRKRPGMYIGDVRAGGLLRLIWEVVANALDQHLAGHCQQITVSLRADGAVSVEDDGQGFPLHDDRELSFVERALTTLHHTPTLDGHAPHEHVGNQGVGLAPVCALSSWLELDIFRAGRHYWQRFERGLAVTSRRDVEAAQHTGTRLTFAPDPTIFPDPRQDSQLLLGRLTEMAYFLPSLVIRFKDDREPPGREQRLHQPRGLLAYVEDAAGNSEARLAETFLVTRTEGEIRIEAAAHWRRGTHGSVDSFANIERTTSGGTHTRGLILGLSDGFRQAAPAACARKGRVQLEAALMQGLSAVVCVRLDDASFGEPTRSRLITPAVEAAVRHSVAQPFARYLAREPALLEQLGAALRSPQRALANRRRRLGQSST